MKIQKIVSPMSRDAFIKHLVEKNKFEQIAPWTLLFEDERDVITVSIRPGVVIITADGHGVVPSWNVIQIREGPDTYFWDEILQTVLHKF